MAKHGFTRLMTISAGVASLVTVITLHSDSDGDQSADGNYSRRELR